MNKTAKITSPGHLPNHLDTEQIRFGLSNLRNPALASHAFHILPYRGLGSGIPRAIEEWPQLEFIDDRRGNQFRVIIWRPDVQLEGAMTPQVAPQVTPQVLAFLQVATREMSRQEMMNSLDLKDRKHFSDSYLQPALNAELIEMTLPDKPSSSKQQYRLTEKGRAVTTGHHP